MPSDAATASGGGSPGPRRQERLEPLVEHAPILCRDTEQFADHAERERVGEAGDEVDDGVRSLRLQSDSSSSAVCWIDGFAARPSRDGTNARRDQLAQAGVIGRVDVQHVPGERRTG